MAATTDLARIGRDLRAIHGRLHALFTAHTIDSLEIIMTALTDMGTAVADLETASAATAAEFAKLNSGEDETTLAGYVSRVQAVTTALNGLVPAPAADPAPEQPAS